MIDNAYWGGKRRGYKQGRGAEGKTPFISAISLNNEGEPMQIRMTVIKGFTHDEMQKWTAHHLMSDSQVVSDGLACFSSVKTLEGEHFSLKTSGNYELMNSPLFKWVNIIIGNVKTH